MDGKNERPVAHTGKKYLAENLSSLMDPREGLSANALFPIVVLCRQGSGSESGCAKRNLHVRLKQICQQPHASTHSNHDKCSA